MHPDAVDFLSSNKFSKIVSGAIKSTFDSHKKLTPELTSSVTKRILGEVKAIIQEETNK